MRILCALSTALLLSLAGAHSELEKATPAEDATVSAPKAVELSFGEPLKLRFSTFKVYPLSVKNGAAPRRA